MKVLLALLACAATLASSAHAGSLVDVQVTDRSTGQVLEPYRRQGRLYVVGTPGSRYAVNLINKTGNRVLTVLSVDGVNAVSGETAAASQSGYVLGPGQTAGISGWRKSQDEVAAFYFTSVADSYAGRTDRPRNVGVIGVAVFRESEPPRPAPLPAPMTSRDSAEADAVTVALAPAAHDERIAVFQERALDPGRKLDRLGAVPADLQQAAALILLRT